MKKYKSKHKNKIANGFIGGVILILILNFIVKPLIEKKDNPENKKSMCKFLSMTIEECNDYEKTGKMPERSKIQLNKKMKEIIEQQNK